ncbi:hypothetical protein UFOVP882_14 [uncultured Caudovirales phage]|jgi:hypothetical protein|uniref:Uncharacterized protein n=1 Tax=uncultured Caudovirales phage TaxID=2100421 RepID=A0A6J5PAB4_9CAUD|nr:hypothetical protein UFOVP882_14 [uncultured Caudovirales phage]
MLLNKINLTCYAEFLTGAIIVGGVALLGVHF